MEKAQPAGWTPIQLALNEAQKDLEQFKGEENTNIVYLVSDGISIGMGNYAVAASASQRSDLVMNYELDVNKTKPSFHLSK